MSTNTELIARLKEQCDRDAVEHCPAEIIALQAEGIATIEKLEAEVERLGMALHGYQVAIETAEESLKDRVALAMALDCGHRPPCEECRLYPPTAQQAQPESAKFINCQYGESGYACCEGRPCQADIHNESIAQQAQPEPEPSVPEGWKQAVALAYGHLWHVNNEPMAPIPLRSSETAAYEARKQLRDLLTREERGLAINQVQALLAAAPQPKEKQ